MKKIVCALAIALLSQRAGSLIAQKKDRDYMIYGPVDGNVAASCGSFTNGPSPQKDVYTWWIDGFVTGAGYSYSKANISLAFSDVNGIHGWVDKYCTDHPLDTLPKAAIALVDELRMRSK